MNKNRILLSNNKEQITGPYNTTSESQKHYGDQEKPDKESI